MRSKICFVDSPYCSRCTENLEGNHRPAIAFHGMFDNREISIKLHELALPRVGWIRVSMARLFATERIKPLIKCLK